MNVKDQIIFMNMRVSTLPLAVRESRVPIREQIRPDKRALLDRAYSEMFVNELVKNPGEITMSRNMVRCQACSRFGHAADKCPYFHEFIEMYR